jgi:hypothetical protein
MNAVTVENRDLKMVRTLFPNTRYPSSLFESQARADKQRCQDAESKIDLIAEWINEVTNNSGSPNPEGTEVNLPPLMIDDFSPALGSSSQMPNTNTNTILSSGISQLNLAKLSHLKGTLTMGRKGLGLGSMGGSGMGMGMGMGRI